MLKRLLALVIKEFISIWQDKRARITLIVPPLMQFFIFTFAATLDVNNVSLGVLNHDSGQSSIELIQRLEGSSIFKKIINLESNEEVARVMDMQEVLLVIQFDETFSKNVNAGQTANIQVILDGRKSNTAQIVQGYINTIAEKYNQELAHTYNRQRIKSVIIQRNWFNPNLIYTWFTISGLVGTLSLIGSISFTALSIAREREVGTLDQLLVSPMTPFEILLGKIIPPLLIGFLQATTIFLLGILTLGLPVHGNVPLLFLSLLIFILAIEGVGIVISCLAKTQQQATLGVFMFMTPAIAISGFATPVASMPLWLQWVSIFNPLKYFLIIIRGICFKAMPPDEIWRNIVPMIFIAIGTLCLSILLFKRKTG